MSTSVERKRAKRETNGSDGVGVSVERLDAVEKVNGSVSYIDDIDFGHIKHVRVARSTVPHGTIRAIDPSEAEAMPGVDCVVTRADIWDLQEAFGLDPFYGPAIRDQPVLALEKVHYIGEPVAAVVADSPTIAAEAADAIDITYDELPYVTDIDEALVEGAPIVHDTFEPADTFDDLTHVDGGETTNLAYEFNLYHGDVSAGFADADYVFEGTYRTPPVQQMPLEPFVSVADFDGESLTVWTANQSPHFVRNELAEMFAIPESKVEIVVPTVGGSYGAKTYCKTEPLAAVCALVSGSRVKVKLTLHESFDTITRSGTKFAITSGVTTDGQLVARRCDVYYDSGAYADIVPRMVKKSGYTASGPYEIPNVEINSHCVYTNKAPSGALRGFGVPQLVWAYERHMDDIACELGIDPIAFRVANGFDEGSIHPTGASISSVGLAACLHAVADEIEGASMTPPDDPDIVRGSAVACGYKACLTPSSSGAIVTASGDGSITIHTSSVEIGQGVHTTLAQMASERLGVPLKRISVAHPDTDVSPFDTISAGSRSTFHMGNAVIAAIDDLLAQLIEIVATSFAAPPAEIDLENGRLVHRPSGDSIALGEAVKEYFGRAGGTLVGRGYFVGEGGDHDPETGRSDDPTVFWFFGATGAIVDVDRGTGTVDIVELHNAADVGRAIDPRRVRAQLQGAAAQALGHTLNETIQHDFGQQVNATLLDYKLPSFRDMPNRTTNTIIEVEHESGPFGAKGVGETGTFGVAPAVANAIADATGARLTELPLTPEVVFSALQKQPTE